MLQKAYGWFVLKKASAAVLVAKTTVDDDLDVKEKTIRLYAN